MKLKIKRNDLKRLVSIADAIGTTRGVSPVYAHVRLVVSNGGKLIVLDRINSTGLCSVKKELLEGDIDNADGVFLFPCAILSGFIASIDDDADIDMSTDDAVLRATLRSCGRKMVVNGLDPQSFFDMSKAFSINTTLANAIDMASFNAAISAVGEFTDFYSKRPVAKVVSVSFNKGDITSYGADGYCVGRFKSSINPGLGNKTFGSMTLSRDAIASIKRLASLLPDAIVSVAATENGSIAIMCDEVLLVVKTDAIVYPDLDSLMPKTCANHLKFKAVDMVKTLNFMDSGFDFGESKCIVLSFEDSQIKVESYHSKNQVEDAVKCEYAGGFKPDFKLYFNPGHIRRAICGKGEDCVVLNLDTRTGKPVLFKNENGLVALVASMFDKSSEEKTTTKESV